MHYHNAFDIFIAHQYIIQLLVKRSANSKRYKEEIYGSRQHYESSDSALILKFLKKIESTTAYQKHVPFFSQQNNSGTGIW